MYGDVSSELISIGLTVLIIDKGNQLLATREEKSA